MKCYRIIQNLLYIRNGKSYFNEFNPVSCVVVGIGACCSAGGSLGELVFVVPAVCCCTVVRKVAVVVVGETQG